MIKHIILWDFTKEIKDNNKEKETLDYIKESVNTLKNIQGLLDIGITNNLSETSDLVFYSEFDNIESLKLFQSNPLHEAHKKRCKNIVENRRVIDFEI